jgi:FkbM family methyltransferase
MPIMLSAPMRLYRRASKVFGQDSIYPTLADAWRAFHLRFAAEPKRGKKPGRTYQVHVKNNATPLYVRKNTSDFLVLRDIFEDGEYQEAKLFNLPADATILDLGGNIGMSVCYFAGLCPQSKLVGVEPDAANFEVMSLNCQKLVHDRRATLVRAFVAATDGQAGIDRSDDAWGFKKTDAPAAAGAETVPCVSMNSLIKRAGWDRIDLMKCDIEGTERELFADCGGWIGMVKHLIVETHPPYTPDDLFAALGKVGWGHKVVYQNLFTPSPRLFLSRV